MKWLVNGLNWVATRAGSLFSRRAAVVAGETAAVAAEQGGVRAAAGTVAGTASHVAPNAAAGGVNITVNAAAPAAGAGTTASGSFLGNVSRWGKRLLGLGGAGYITYSVGHEHGERARDTPPGNPIADAFNDVKKFVTQNLGFGMGSLIGAGALAIIGGLLTASPVVAIAAAVLGAFVGQPVFDNLAAAFKQSPTDPNAAGAGNAAGTEPTEERAPGEQLHANVSANLQSTSPNSARTT